MVQGTAAFISEVLASTTSSFACDQNTETLLSSSNFVPQGTLLGEPLAACVSCLCAPKLGHQGDAGGTKPQPSHKIRTRTPPPDSLPTMPLTTSQWVAS